LRAGEQETAHNPVWHMHPAVNHIIKQNSSLIMIKFFHIFLYLFFIAPTNLLSGQEQVFLDSAQIRVFLEKPEFNQTVKDFWQGRLHVSDNDETLV